MGHVFPREAVSVWAFLLPRRSAHFLFGGKPLRWRTETFQPHQPHGRL